MSKNNPQKPSSANLSPFLTAAEPSSPQYRALEPRVLLDAAVTETLDSVDNTDVENVEAVAELAIDDAGQLFAAEPKQQASLVFVDQSVEGYEDLLVDISPDIDVVVFDFMQNGLDQMEETLAGYEQLESIHIVSHGSDGSVRLGGVDLTLNNLDDYATLWQEMNQRLAADGDILFYGCNLAETENGQALINEIAELTDADVAASTDFTGLASLGGDWELEYQSGPVQAAELFDHDYAGFKGVLATEWTEADVVAIGYSDDEKSGSSVAADGDWVAVSNFTHNENIHIDDDGDSSTPAYDDDGVPGPDPTVSQQAKASVKLYNVADAGRVEYEINPPGVDGSGVEFRPFDNARAKRAEDAGGIIPGARTWQDDVDDLWVARYGLSKSPGLSIDISGDYIIIGDPAGNQAWIYQWDATAINPATGTTGDWVLNQTLDGTAYINSGSDSGQAFGWDVAIETDYNSGGYTAVVSDPLWGAETTVADTDDNIPRTNKNVNSNGRESDWFSESITVGFNTLKDRGKVYGFKSTTGNTNSWVGSGADTTGSSLSGSNPDRSGFAYHGYSVDIAGGKVFIGEWGYSKNDYDGDVKNDNDEFNVGRVLYASIGSNGALTGLTDLDHGDALTADDYAIGDGEFMGRAVDADYLADGTTNLAVSTMDGQVKWYDDVLTNSNPDLVVGQFSGAETDGNIFDASVAVYEGFFAIGDHNGENANGLVHQYQNGVLLDGLSNPPGNSPYQSAGSVGEEFGWSVALAEDLMIIGAPFLDDIPGLSEGLIDRGYAQIVYNLDLNRVSPIAEDDVYTVPENGISTLPAWENDTLGDNPGLNPISYSKLEVTSGGGSVYAAYDPISNSTAIMYDPGTAYDYLQATQTATVIIDYELTDHFGKTDPATVTLTIDGENDAPIKGSSINDTLLVAQGETESYDLSSVFGDPDQGEGPYWDLQILSITPPDGGNLIENGSFSAVVNDVVTNWTIRTEVDADPTTTRDGNNTLKVTQLSDSGDFNQNIRSTAYEQVVGEQYTLSFNARSSGNVDVRAFGITTAGGSGNKTISDATPIGSEWDTYSMPYEAAGGDQAVIQQKLQLNLWNASNGDWIEFDNITLTKTATDITVTTPVGAEHRYSFDNDWNDTGSVTNNLTNNSTVQFAIDAERGNVAQFTPNDYLTTASPIALGAEWTVATWAKNDVGQDASGSGASYHYLGLGDSDTGRPFYLYNDSRAEPAGSGGLWRPTIEGNTFNPVGSATDFVEYFGSTTSNGKFFDGNWHHLAVSVSGNTAELYFDGTLIGTVTDPLITNIGNDVTNIKQIGGTGYSNHHFADYLDDFVVLDDALAELDVQKLYQFGPSKILNVSADSDALMGDYVITVQGKDQHGLVTPNDDDHYEMLFTIGRPNEAPEIVNPQSVTWQAYEDVAIGTTTSLPTPWAALTDYSGQNPSMVWDNDLNIGDHWYQFKGNYQDASGGVDAINNGVNIFDDSERGQVGYFDQDADYLAPSSAVSIGTDWTISTYFKSPNLSGNAILATNDTTGSFERHFVMANNGVLGLHEEAGGFNSSGASLAAYDDAEWHQLTVTGSGGGTTQFYIDGKKVGETVGAVVGSLTAFGGADSDSTLSSKKPFALLLDDVVFRPGVLDSKQVKSMYYLGPQAFMESLTYNLGETAPDWLKIDSQTGLLTGTPENDSVGDFVAPVYVVDQFGEFVSVLVEITIIESNDTPDVETVPNQILEGDVDFQLELSDYTNDIDKGQNLTYIIEKINDKTPTANKAPGDAGYGAQPGDADYVGLPEGLSFSSNNGLISGTIVRNGTVLDGAEFKLDIRVTDSSMMNGLKVGSDPAQQHEAGLTSVENDSIMMAPFILTYVNDIYVGEFNDLHSTKGIEANGAFGTALAISADGTKRVVSAPGIGKVYLQTRSGADWGTLATAIEIDSGLTASDKFGFAVAINEDGSRVAVGAQGINNSTGEVYIYNGSGGPLGTIGASEVANAIAAGQDQLAPLDRFGSSLAFNEAGTGLVVGASAYGYNDTGGAFIFYLNAAGTGVTNAHQLLPSTVIELNASFGAAVAWDGDAIVVGAGRDEGDSGAEQSGKVYVFKADLNTANAPSEVESFSMSRAGVTDQAYAWFGFSVDVDQTDDGLTTIIAVGSPNERSAASNAGSVFTFRDDGGLAGTLLSNGGFEYITGTDLEPDFGTNASTSPVTDWSSPSATDATLVQTNDGYVARITRTDTSTWNHRIDSSNFDIVAGEFYTLTFKARSGHANPADTTPVNMYSGIRGSSGNQAIDNDYDIANDWQTYSLPTFQANNSGSSYLRLSHRPEGALGEWLEFDNISLVKSTSAEANFRPIGQLLAPYGQKNDRFGVSVAVDIQGATAAEDTISQGVLLAAGSSFADTDGTITDLNGREYAAYQGAVYSYRMTPMGNWLAEQLNAPDSSFIANGDFAGGNLSGWVSGSQSTITTVEVDDEWDHWYQFDDGLGATEFKDASGNHAASMPASSDVSIFDDPDRGFVARFTSSASYASLGTGTPITLGDDWTIATWVKNDAPDSTQTKYHILAGGVTGAPLYLYNDVTETQGKYRPTLWAQDNPGPPATAPVDNERPVLFQPTQTGETDFVAYFGSNTQTGKFFDGNWHHLAIVSEAASNTSAITSLYFDGVKIGETIEHAKLKDITNIGNDSGTPNQRFADYLDDFMVYGVALEGSGAAGSDIEDLYYLGPDAGNSALRLTQDGNDGSDWEKRARYSFDTAPPAGDYTLSFKARASDSSVKLTVFQMTPGNSNPVPVGVGVAVGDVWQSWEVPVTLYGDETSFDFNMYPIGTDGDWIDFDDIKLVNPDTKQLLYNNNVLGHSVDLAGDQIISGARWWDNGANTQAGKVYSIQATGNESGLQTYDYNYDSVIKLGYYTFSTGFDALFINASESGSAPSPHQGCH